MVPESAGSGFDPRLVCFGDPDALAVLTNVVRSPKSHRSSALRQRAVSISPQPRSQRRPRRSSDLRRSSRSNVLEHVGRTQRRAAALHAAVIRRDRQAVDIVREGGTSRCRLPWKSGVLRILGKQVAASLAGVCAVQSGEARQGGGQGELPALPSRLPPRLGPCGFLWLRASRSGPRGAHPPRRWTWLRHRVTEPLYSPESAVEGVAGRATAPTTSPTLSPIVTTGTVTTRRGTRTGKHRAAGEVSHHVPSLSFPT